MLEAHHKLPNCWEGHTEVPSTPTDLEMLLAARDGDHAAGRSLVTAHGTSMVRTAWSVLGQYGGTETDDVVQEAFVSALTTSALPHGDDVGAWLRAITARKALDWLRQTTRRREQPLPEPDEDAALTMTAGNPEATLDALTVRKALAVLAPVDRAVLVLADIEGHSMREVAETLGLTRVAVKLRASRARRKLARMLGSETDRRRS
jgi:RNA polymerase sigma-70 factor (ECF subfamily)